MRVARLIAAMMLLPPLQAAPSTTSDGVLSANDVAAIKATIEAYRTAWLRNDKAGVLSTFTNDAVLVPAHGGTAVVGIGAIEKYWFAPGPPATVTLLDITVEQLEGSGSMAFARGVDNVGWTMVQDGKSQKHYHPGTYLNVMKKLPGGSWRIHLHMWDDGKETVQ
jgi:uncharacterized protein (TIGR02246 family)